MFLFGKALLIYKAKRIISAIEAIAMVATALFVIGGMLIAL